MRGRSRILTSYGTFSSSLRASHASAAHSSASSRPGIKETWKGTGRTHTESQRPWNGHVTLGLGCSLGAAAAFATMLLSMSIPAAAAQHRRTKAAACPNGWTLGVADNSRCSKLLFSGKETTFRECASGCEGIGGTMPCLNSSLWHKDLTTLAAGRAYWGGAYQRP